MKHNKTLFFACAAALTLMASCSKEELSPLRFHATIENNDAKCAVDVPNNNVVWNDNEVINIYASGNESGETWIASRVDAQNATFTHQGHSNMEGVETTTYYAVSNVISSGSLNTNGTLNLTINPTVNALNPIAFMASKSTGCDLHFKHFAGMLKFVYSVENIPTNGTWTLESISIRANGAALSGNFNITFDANGVPTAAANSQNGNTLTYNTTATTGTVCFPVMPGDYSNFAIVFTVKKNKQTKTCTKTFNGTLSMEKGQLRVVNGTITASAWN